MASNESLFEQATAWLSQHGVGAVDWSALATRRQDSVTNPAYMDQYLLPAFHRAAAVIDTLDLPRRPPKEVVDAYAVLASDVTSVGQKAIEIGKINLQVTQMMLFPNREEFGLKLNLLMYGLFIYLLWSAALMSGEAHIKGIIHRSGTSDAEIAFSASLTTMAFNLIGRLDQWGLLSPLKKRATSGLGAVPLAAILVLGAVAIIAIVWGVVAIYQLSRTYKVIEAACDRMVESGDPEAVQKCQALMSSPAADVTGEAAKAAGGVIQKVALMAMIGVGAYVLFLFGPGIASSLKRTIGAWKES